MGENALQVVRVVQVLMQSGQIGGETLETVVIAKSQLKSGVAIEK